MWMLLILSLLANAALGFLVWDTRRDFVEAEDVFDAKVDHAQQKLAAITAAAVEKIPDVDAVKSDLNDLEQKLFGFGGAGFTRDVIGNLQGDVRSLEFDLSSFKSCMNRALSSSFDSYNRASNSYFGGGTYYVPRCY